MVYTLDTAFTALKYPVLQTKEVLPISYATFAPGIIDAVDVPVNDMLLAVNDCTVIAPLTTRLPLTT